MKTTIEKPLKKDQATPVSKKASSETKKTHSSVNTESDNQSANNASYSESHEVTPPVAHEVPSIGNTKSDFENAGRHGRTTSRMIDHEPGL